MISLASVGGVSCYSHMTAKHTIGVISYDSHMIIAVIGSSHSVGPCVVRSVVAREVHQVSPRPPRGPTAAALIARRLPSPSTWRRG